MVTENSEGLGMKAGDRDDNGYKMTCWQSQGSENRRRLESSFCGQGPSFKKTVIIYVWRSEDHSWPSFLPFYLWVFRLGGKYLNLMSHLLSREDVKWIRSVLFL